MRCGSRLQIVCAAVLLIGALAIWGCARRPEVVQSGPVISTPPASVSPTAPGAGGASGGEVPVVRPVPPTETPITRGPQVSSTAVGPGGATAAGLSPLKDVFFEYDKAAIGVDQKTALNDDARWLKANERVRVSVEGHCDERGTAEYNLGLGERRAKAVRDYLVSAGIAANRISTISYGKERPFVPGHDETAWKQNRRAHLAVQGP